MTVCPLANVAPFEGMCDQTQCPFNTALTDTGCWHGEAQVTVDSILRYKQADAAERREFREYVKDLHADLARVELIRSYRWSVADEKPGQEEQALWEMMRGEEPWSFPELRMSAGALAAMLRPANFELFTSNREADLEMTPEQLLFEPFNTMKGN